MSRTSSLRKQHDSLVILADEITRVTETLAASGDVQPLQRLLRQFDTLLTTHLTSEDRLLYPQMLASSDPRAAAIANRFCEEMGGLMEAHAEFAGRWKSTEALLADPDGFRREWGDLLGALAFRIQREDAELYPLADGLADTPERKAG